jgi:hypothetical protein
VTSHAGLVLHDEVLAVNKGDSGGVVKEVVDDVVGVVSADERVVV